MPASASGLQEHRREQREAARQVEACAQNRLEFGKLQLPDRGTDNPDQRIAEDLRLFTSGTLGLVLGLIREAVTLASFAVILWNLSGALPLTLGGTEISVPGYLLWAALLYAVVGSILTHYVGLPAPEIGRILGIPPGTVA